MDDLVTQVLKLRSNFSHTYRRMSVREVIKLGPLGYLYAVVPYENTKEKIVARQSQIIERILLGLDLPAIHIMPDTYEVIRGDDLIIAVFKFVKGVLRLEGLEVLTALKGMTYSDLPPDLQDVFLYYNFVTLEFPLDIATDYISRGYLRENFGIPSGYHDGLYAPGLTQGK